MHIVSRLHATVRAPRRVPWLLFLLFVPLGACSEDGDDGPAGGGGSVLGTWTLAGAQDFVYIEITSGVVRIYQDVGDCFTRNVYDIVDQDDDVFTIEHEVTGDEFEVEIRRDGDDIEVDGEAFVESDVDVSGLDVCAVPALPACDTLTEITLGGNLVGDLGETDATDERGSFFDLYRIEVETEAEWVVEMNSNEIDAYLKLFTAAGELIASNDDFMDSTDSRLVMELAPGCYIVMTTSFSIFETGAYQVSFF